MLIMWQEKIWLVDENDNPIKLITRTSDRRNTKPGDIWRISAILVTDDRGRILIAQRHPSKHYHGGKWGPSAAGTVESHETPLENAQKELEEEVGIKLNLEDFKLINKKFYWSSGGTGRIISIFLARVDSEPKLKLEEDEVSDAKWVDIDELKEDIKLNPDEYVPATAELLEMI